MSRSHSLPRIAAITRSDGLATGLIAAFDRREPLPCSMAGRALLPTALLPEVAAWEMADGVVEADGCRVDVLPHALAQSERLALVEVIRHLPTTDSGRARANWEGPNWPCKLLAVRAGLDRRLLAHAIDHLSSRRFDGAPLTERQLVRAEIAEVAMTLESVETALEAVPGGPEASIWHPDLDRAEQRVSRLFGASGYLDDHPARALRLIALLRDVYAPRDTQVRSAA